MSKIHEEYLLLTEKLEEITWALDGSCNDIDCDKYMYKNLLKKQYKPILKHSYSCIPVLKREKEAAMRLLSLKKFNKFRYEKCKVCKKKLDSLGKDYFIISFTRPVMHEGKKFYQHQLTRAHKKCKNKVIIPKGWEKF